MSLNLLQAANGALLLCESLFCLVAALCMFLVSIREQNARLQQLETSRAQIAEKLEIATMLNRCVAKLSDGIDRNVALQGLMEVVRDYFQADRSYLFEIRQKTFLVNTYEAGDRLICRMAEILKEVFPQQAYRIGGDEFVVILPGIPEPEFDAKVQQLREALLRQKVSAAVGSVWEPAPEDVEVLLRRADDRMYGEKEKIKRA